MPYSLEILVVNQVDFVELEFESNLKLEWEGGRLGDIRLRKTWPIMSSIPGIWYNVLIKEEVYFNNTALLFDTDYDVLINQDTYYWVKNDYRKEYITPFIIKEKYFLETKKIIEFLVEKSPQKTILLLPLYEKGKIEIIQGPMILSEYFELLNDNKIPFNVCTIVKKE